MVMKNNRNRVSTARRVWRALVVALVLSLVGSCRPPSESGDAVPQRDINAVMASHVDELMAIPKVVGVAIGQLDDGTPCILVLVEEETKEITKKVPAKLEGYPVKVFVSGEIKPMDDN